MADNFKTISDLDISFKEFMPGQIIQSAQFNDDMRDIEEKVNEVIGQHNEVANTVVDHLNNKNNPHEVTAHQVGAYTIEEADGLYEEIKNGHLYDNAITNRVLGDGCVDNRTLKDKTITAVKVEDGFGNQIDISENIEITDRYTKSEVDELVRSKVGEGAYTKEEIDQKFKEFQSGQIIDKTISADKVTSDFGDNIDISNNTSITNRYTKGEVDMLISMNGLPRDWGNIIEQVDVDTGTGSLPVAGHMVAGQFVSPATSVLDIDVKENVEARGEYNSVGERLNGVDSQIKEIANRVDEISSSGGSGGSSGGTTTSDYDTEISLPFTANGGNVDVKLVFSKGNEISNPSYTNEVAGNTPNNFDVLKYGSPTGYTLENTTVDGINCLKFQYTGGVHYYRLYSKKDTNKTYGSDKWFAYMKIKLGGDADINYLPTALSHISYNLTSIAGYDGTQLGSQLNKNSTDWQVISVAGQVSQNDSYMKLNPHIGFSQITGTVYIARMCLVNLTAQGLESKTKSELFAMAENGEFDNNSSSATTTEFSCTVTNGSITEDIAPFTDTGVTKYYTVSNGNTLSIAQRTGYGMPSIQALIKSTSTVEIEDCELKLNTRFKGKKVIFEGDSITDYDYLEGYNNKSWANYLTAILGMNLVSNGAVGGSLLTHSNEAVGFSVQQRIANTNYDSKAKLFLIHAGTNDWGQAKTLGDIDSTDISTICGALNNIIDKIQTNCPKATIVIISPIHRQSDSGGFYNNSAGFSLYDIAVAYQKICLRWGAKFINGLEIGLNALNETNLNNNYIDGLHPTPVGHKIMAVEIARKISTF